MPRYLHAARQDADSRYRSAAVRALGEERGRVLVSDPAWGAVVRRLFDAEGDGWDPARLLATAAQRELASADSIAEVITWRLDAFLAGNPVSPPADVLPTVPEGQPYETGTRARARLTAVAVTTLGTSLADRARREVAWPALVAALRRAENAGFDPVDALTRTATSRELRTARSVSEVLAWRISRHVAAHPACTLPAAAEPEAAATAESPAPDATRAEPPLPWVPGPRLVPARADEARPLTGYVGDAASVITARVAELADIANLYRPPWMSLLGEQPTAPYRAREWRRHVAVIAAYRDQHNVTADDPRQVLGPYAEPGHAGHKAYWHAAETPQSRSKPPKRGAGSHRLRDRHPHDSRTWPEPAPPSGTPSPGTRRAGTPAQALTAPSNPACSKLPARVTPTPTACSQNPNRWGPPGELR